MRARCQSNPRLTRRDFVDVPSIVRFRSVIGGWVPYLRYTSFLWLVCCTVGPSNGISCYPPRNGLVNGSCHFKAPLPPEKVPITADIIRHHRRFHTALGLLLAFVVESLGEG